MNKLPVAVLLPLLGEHRFALHLDDVRQIGVDALRQAFTELCRRHNRWICGFREGKSHVSPDGAIRRPPVDQL